MRIDAIGSGSQYYNYSPRVNAQNKVRTGQLLNNQDTMALLLSATPCSSKEEAIAESMRNPGQIFSWGTALYKNGKRLN